jgi:UDP-N-acetylenolpyruvoylglucosamine reductase
VIGRGSNLIVPDQGVDGLVISLSHQAWAGFARLPDGRVRAGGGLRLKELCGHAAKAGVGGLEFLEGIPGSVGGALRMNAGAMGGWMFDVVEEVELIGFDGSLRTMAKSQLQVGYRHCAELHEAIALGAVLRPAAPAEAELIKRQMETYAQKRRESQPRAGERGLRVQESAGHQRGPPD